MTTGDIRTVSMGRTQRGVRDHNERLVMSTLMREGAMSGRDLARVTGLSAQTVSIILRQLEQEGLLKRGDPVRGRVGKPSIPMALAPDGAYSVGLKIGRRSADLLLVNLHGDVVAQRRVTYRYPLPDSILAFLRDGIAYLETSIPAHKRDRICGIGIARPSEIWSWHDAIGAAQGTLDAWRDTDLAAMVAEFSDLPVYVDNDGTSASRAELIFGSGERFRNYAYFFVGFFLGGGVILNDSVFHGPHGRAGAFGPMSAKTGDGRNCQLMDAASLITLEAMLDKKREDSGALWRLPLDWSKLEPTVGTWIEQTARHLAEAAITVCSVIDFEALVIDGGFSSDVRKRLVVAVNTALDGIDARGVIRPKVIEGTIGHNARALGAAAAPIITQYLIDAHEN